MRTNFKREQSDGQQESGADDDPNGVELQCLDCYAIFHADGPAGRADCESCGSSNTAMW